MAWFVSIDGNVTGPHADGAVVDGLGKGWIPPRAKISPDQASWSALTSHAVFAATMRDLGLAPAPAPVIQQIYAPSPYDDYPMQSGTNGMAIAGFVLAFFCSPLGLILSWIARGQIRDAGGRQGGDGLALAGIIISVLGLFIGVVSVATR